jgi:hypothetical protein
MKAQIQLALLVALLFLGAAAGLYAQGPSAARAQTGTPTYLPIPPSQWDDLAGTALAAMVRHESHSGRDVDAIAWTMARRWFAHACHRGERFGEYVIQTSRFLRRDRYELHHEAAHGLRTDVELRDRLDHWARGGVPDPCASASFQWRSPGVPGPGKRVHCGDTSNRFYEHPRSGQSRAVAALARGRQVCR